MTLNMINERSQINLGCDPEFFFERGGQVVGSEKVVDADGKKKYEDARKAALEGRSHELISNELYGASLVVMDGVQAELNPPPSTCRESLASAIGAAMKALKARLSGYEGITASFKTVIEVPEEELRSLSERSRVLGCAPSLNSYGAPSATLTTIDAAAYRTRSAGGHLHFGGSAHYGVSPQAVPLLDLMVGNTCVMLDTDPKQKERRKLYGRAGEHRLPKHGLEYRTLSNFWLRSYPLMSLVHGLARQAISLRAADVNMAKQNEPEILSLVDRDAVITAINENDVSLAWENWSKIRGFIRERFRDDTKTPSSTLYPGCNQPHSLYASNLDAFEFFARKGLDFWFKKDPLEHWCEVVPGGGSEPHYGWERYAQHVIPRVMQQAATLSLTKEIVLS